MELVSEGLTDVENRLQETAAGCLRTEYPAGKWKETVGSGARRKSTVCRKRCKMRDQWGDRTALLKPRHLHPSVFSVLDEALGFSWRQEVPPFAALHHSTHGLFWPTVHLSPGI